MDERCEACGVAHRRMRHDAEGVPLCPPCWLAEPIHSDGP